MTSNAERREQVLWQMVSYLQGVVDGTASHEVAVRVGGAMDSYYCQLDEIEDKAESGWPRVECVPCAAEVSSGA